mmetsp:Transcript_12167/g.37293  ORF Transcript_12167/g.37293 Transcript_12167/m.37293 type:complete len:160 (-) Transcript_12167:67-546(-)
MIEFSSSILPSCGDRRASWARRATAGIQWLRLRSTPAINTACRLRHIARAIFARIRMMKCVCVTSCFVRSLSHAYVLFHLGNDDLPTCDRDNFTELALPICLQLSYFSLVVPLPFSTPSLHPYASLFLGPSACISWGVSTYPRGPRPLSTLVEEEALAR